MARGSFAKIQGNLDLSTFLYPYDRLERPWNPSAIFGRTAPLELEIGSGKGLFLCNAALAAPDRNFLGIEVAARYALISAARLAKNGVRNAAMVNADAAKMLDELIPPESLAAVHVYFPDPWWKKAHRKRRVLRSEVVRAIENRLMPGGILYFRTDVLEYYRSTLDLVAADTSLSGPIETEYGEKTPGAAIVECGADNSPASVNADIAYSTHFERRTLLHHLPVFGCRWTRN